MTNREQIGFVLGFREYDDAEVAAEICDMIDAVGGDSYGLKEPLTKWLALTCDPDTNEWGKLVEDQEA